MTRLERFRSTWGDQRYWPTPVAPLAGPPGAALNLLRESVSKGATLVALGAFTNLALLDRLGVQLPPPYA